MRLFDHLEVTPRGAYTGALFVAVPGSAGLIGPDPYAGFTREHVGTAPAAVSPWIPIRRGMGGECAEDRAAPRSRSSVALRETCRVVDGGVPLWTLHRERLGYGGCGEGLLAEVDRVALGAAATLAGAAGRMHAAQRQRHAGRRQSPLRSGTSRRSPTARRPQPVQGHGVEVAGSSRRSRIPPRPSHSTAQWVRIPQDMEAAAALKEQQQAIIVGTGDERSSTARPQRSGSSESKASADHHAREPTAIPERLGRRSFVRRRAGSIGLEVRATSRSQWAAIQRQPTRRS